MEEIEEILDEADIKYNRFKKFDVIPSYYPPKSHYFLEKKSTNIFGSVKTHNEASIYNIKHREWELLKKHLPKSIFVRAYESEDYVGLMRAVIVGPPGTPYCYSLFFFDIYLPPDYPRSPPQFFYHSHGYSINTNVQEDGKVCHSLLNTLDGDGKGGTWDRNLSSLLQVLKAIRSSILSAKPFLNKPDLEKNEVFKLSCKKMVRTLNRPPWEFEDFVKGHFRLYSHLILLSCKQYLDNGAKLGPMVEYLYDGFQHNGSYVKHHKYLLEYKRDDEEENQSGLAVQGKNEVLSRTWMNFKTIMG